MLMRIEFNFWFLAFLVAEGVWNMCVEPDKNTVSPKFRKICGCVQFVAALYVLGLYKRLLWP